MNRHAIPLHAALAAAAFAAHSAVGAQSAERGCVELKTVAEIEQAYVDERGQPAKRLVPAAKVVPGDEIVWTIVASNVCTTAAGDVAITNAVPAHMHYVGNSAFGPGADIQFSLDGRVFAAASALSVTELDGTKRPARADEYSHIRFAVPQPIGPSESLMVRYRATVL
jgi:uncharacterized repeat protein (TIGR01451 family)